LQTFQKMQKSGSRGTYRANSLKPAPAIIVASEVAIGHSSWTDCAREPVKTSLDAEDSKDSNELDKNIHLLLKFWGKIYKAVVSFVCTCTWLKVFTLYESYDWMFPAFSSWKFIV